ncbi:oligopeptide ABC transporter permease OppC [Salmonella enterica subsp. enterica serovar 4,12:i:-]|nr:oligopeptide ABC transporter permease OppC [Salmonella enterica subsp. enterica serovar 4,12:i:-]
MMLSKKNSETLENFSEKLEVEGRSLWQDARRRFMHNRAAVASLIVLFLIALFVTVAPMLSQFTYFDTDWGMMSSAPDMASGHYFGTDSSGRDLLVRVAIGGRISLMVGIAAALVAVIVGTLYGSLSGYLGGKIDSVMMRLLEILNSFPFMFFVILLVTFFGQNILLIFVAIGMVSWLDMARIVRGQTLSLKRKEFIEAAQVGGVSTASIVIRHIVPNVLGVVVVYASLLVPSMILFESFLSFLGLGTQEPLSSWGALLSDGANSMEVSPWLLLFPAGFLVVTLFCFNFIGDVTAVNDLNFTLRAGETLGIVGESGSGKSQTAFALMGLLATNGRIGGSATFNGREILNLPERELNTLRAEQISMIFQDPMTSLNPYMRVGEQLMEVLMLHKGMSKAEAFEESVRMLDAVKMPEARKRMKMYPHEFSGGMRQRVMIAMALLCRPKLLIADEPTTALDVTVQAQIMTLLNELKREFNTAIIMITHDLGVVAGICDKVLVMYAGRTMEYGKARDVFYQPVHPYSIGLLNAVPRLDSEGAEMLTIPGNPPNLLRLPKGCPFQPRCPHAMEICNNAPPLEAFSPGRLRACFKPVEELL